MTIEELKQEASLITKENVKFIPKISRTMIEDFQVCWQKYGKDFAQLYIMPAIWYGRISRPSEVL